MKSNPSTIFSKQLMEFSAELKNNAYKNLGLAAIIDIKFVPTVTKNKVRVAEVEKIEEKLKKTKSVSKINHSKKTIETESNLFVDENGRIK